MLNSAKSTRLVSGRSRDRSPPEAPLIYLSIYLSSNAGYSNQNCFGGGAGLSPFVSEVLIILSPRLYDEFSMTKPYRSKVGPKGQVVILKKLRERYGIKEGRLVEQVETSRGLLLLPVSGEKLMMDLEAVAREIGRIWPPGKSAVEAIRQERDKRWSRK